MLNWLDKTTALVQGLNPWSEVGGTMRRMNSAAEQSDEFERRVKRGEVEGSIETMRSALRPQFRSADAGDARKVFREKVQWILGGHSAFQGMRCAPEQSIAIQAKRLATSIARTMKSGTNGYRDITVDDVLDWHGRRTDRMGDPIIQKAKEILLTDPSLRFLTEEQECQLIEDRIRSLANIGND